MKRVIIKNLDGIQTHGADLKDPSAWIADCVANNYWGLPERWVPHADDIDAADVLEEREAVVWPAYTLEVEPAIEAKEAVLDSDGNILEPAVEASPAVLEEIPAKTRKEVKLRAEYTIEIVDITTEQELASCIQKRRAEYPSAEDFLNAFFDGGDEALEALRQKRLAIKAKYPKP